MACRCRLILAAILALAGTIQASAQNTDRTISDHEKLVGAWKLVSLQAPDSHGQPQTVAGLTGELIYSPGGHVSVQIMYPQSQRSISNDYVLNGYEASFGSYDVNESAHTITHHIQGSVTRGLVGKDLARLYQISGRRLIIHSVRADEHWSVTWEHE